MNLIGLDMDPCFTQGFVKWNEGDRPTYPTFHPNDQATHPPNTARPPSLLYTPSAWFLGAWRKSLAEPRYPAPCRPESPVPPCRAVCLSFWPDLPPQGRPIRIRRAFSSGSSYPLWRSAPVMSSVGLHALSADDEGEWRSVRWGGRQSERRVRRTGNRSRTLARTTGCWEDWWSSGPFCTRKWWHWALRGSGCGQKCQDLSPGIPGEVRDHARWMRGRVGGSRTPLSRRTEHKQKKISKITRKI